MRNKKCLKIATAYFIIKILIKKKKKKIGLWMQVQGLEGFLNNYCLNILKKLIYWNKMKDYLMKQKKISLNYKMLFVLIYKLLYLKRILYMTVYGSNGFYYIFHHMTLYSS